MIDPKLWLQNIIETIKAIADTEYQKNVWLRGQNSPFASWEELMCNYFDDNAINEFLNSDAWKKSGLNEKQFKKLLQLTQKLDKDMERIEHVEPLKIINNKNWQAIQATAREFLELLLK